MVNQINIGDCFDNDIFSGRVQGEQEEMTMSRRNLILHMITSAWERDPFGGVDQPAING